ncbi:MAG: hypothetical protein Q8R30_02525 [bacterium]|nr:hypothetical protein [bacterium]MDZ4285743.1 hypothetical protein [Candidatus Sungbacteria bacterium]
MKTALLTIVMAMLLSMTAVSAFAKTNVPTNLSSETITLNLKGNAAQNQAQIDAAIQKFIGNCAEINVYSYEVKIVRGNVKAIVVKYT